MPRPGSWGLLGGLATGGRKEEQKKQASRAVHFGTMHRQAIFSQAPSKRVTANSRRGAEAGLTGLKAADGVAMMFGIHGGEEVGGGLVPRLLSPAAPAEASEVSMLSFGPWDAALHVRQDACRNVHDERMCPMRTTGQFRFACGMHR